MPCAWWRNPPPRPRDHAARYGGVADRAGYWVTTTFTGDELSETHAILDGTIFDLMLWAQYILPAGGTRRAHGDDPGTTL